MKPKTFIEYKAEIKKEFTQDDIVKSIFFNQNPTFQTYPFSSFNNSPLSNLPVTFKLKILFENTNLLSLLGKMVKSIGRLEIKEDEIREIPFWMMGFLTDSLNEGLLLWKDYLLNDLKDFCKGSYSQMQWYSVTGGGIKTVFTEFPLTYERQMWVAMNAVTDKNQNAEFMVGIRDSLLPWINPNLYQASEKSKTETRVNTAYEEVKRRFISEDYKILDVIK